MRTCFFAALIGAICGCGTKESASAPAATTNDLSASPTPAPAPAQPAPAQPAGPVPTTATPAPVDKPSADYICYPKAGWSKFKFIDDVPLCVFAGPIQREQAKTLEQVKPVK